MEVDQQHLHCWHVREITLARNPGCGGCPVGTDFINCISNVVEAVEQGMNCQGTTKKPEPPTMCTHTKPEIITIDDTDTEDEYVAETESPTPDGHKFPWSTPHDNHKENTTGQDRKKGLNGHDMNLHAEYAHSQVEVDDCRPMEFCPVCYR